MNRRTLSKIFGGQVWNIGGHFFSTGEAHASPVIKVGIKYILNLKLHSYTVQCLKQLRNKLIESDGIKIKIFVKYSWRIQYSIETVKNMKSVNTTNCANCQAN